MFATKIIIYSPKIFFINMPLIYLFNSIWRVLIGPVNEFFLAKFVIVFLSISLNICIEYSKNIPLRWFF